MKGYVIPLATVGIADAVSYMIVAPSIIFYVLENGGTQSQYGIILSIFSFASFCTKPFLGTWTDTHGFRSPYFVSLGTASFGGLFYFLASAVPDGLTSISAIFLGRFMGGVGAASSALGYAYVARALPNEEQTKMNSLLSMIRIVGMAAGPGVNVFLSDIDFYIWGLDLHVNSLNSVGLVLMVMNLISLCVIYMCLEEPPKEEEQQQHSEHDDGKDFVDEQKNDPWLLIKTILSTDILVYLLSIFSFNANFQIIETAFAPAAKDALDWGPVQTSTVLGSMSIVIFFVMLIVFQLSARKVSDGSLLIYGLIQGGIGYTIIYFCWTKNGNYLQFMIPIMIGAGSFPFLGAPTRSLFTKIVDSKPALDHHHGFMQAMLSMGASVAGFVSPGLIATFVLRSPEEVDASSDDRELTIYALFAPVMSFIVLLGHIYVQRQQQQKQKEKKSDESMNEKNDEEDQKVEVADESTMLVKKERNAADLHKRRYHHRHSLHRQSSSTLMGVSQPHIHEEDEVPT